MKQKACLYLRAILLMLMICISIAVMAETYPAECRVKTNLRVRTGPSQNYAKIDLLHPNDHVYVYAVVGGNPQWGEIKSGETTGYICMTYVEYLYPIEMNPVEETAPTNVAGSSSTFWNDVWSVIRIILIILAGFVVLAFWKQILQGIVYLLVFMGIGALISYLLTGNGSIGSTIGLLVGIVLGLRFLSNKYGVESAMLFRICYNLVSFPFYLLNKLQFFIVEPWRYIFKSNWMSDNSKTIVRPMLFILKILLYIISTPLRVVNAITYNIITHVCIEMYDLLYEVLVPSSYDEGQESIWKWLLYFPARLMKYPIGHGLIVVAEGIIWTVVDTFIPAVTMYHGTDLTAAQAITCSRERTNTLKYYSRWSDGAFTASQSSWGGIGVYFASMRSVARGYACDYHRLSDNNPVMIVCRVSLGNIINYALAPDYVYNNAGQYGTPSVLNKYAEANGYTTGEWWNSRGGYWEFCMFDWQKKYNDLWRIRPIYVYNFRTGFFEHIQGSMQHWLFEKDIWEDLMKRWLK